MSLPTPSHRVSPAFSLVEVVIALGIISFALVALLGLLPAGLSAQKQAASRARCVQTLSEFSDAARGVYTNSDGTTNFPYPLDGITPGAAASTNYVLLGNGRITNTAPAGADVRGKIFVRQYASSNNVSPLYISVAWPASAVRGGTNWQTAQGSIESLIFVTPP